MDNYIRETSDSNKLDQVPTFHTQDAVMEMLSKGYKLGLVREKQNAFIANVSEKQAYRKTFEVPFEIAIGILGNLHRFRVITKENEPTIEMFERK